VTLVISELVCQQVDPLQ